MGVGGPTLRGLLVAQCLPHLSAIQLRLYEITQPVLKLDVDVRSGHIRLLTRTGIVVDADEVVIRSGHVRVKAPWSHDVPVQLHIEISGKVGSGHFVARPRNRNLWQWLTRQPKPYAITAR